MLHWLGRVEGPPRGHEVAACEPSATQRRVRFNLLATQLTACFAFAGCTHESPGGGKPQPATVTPPAVDDDTSGVVGHVAREWQVSDWFNSPPLALQALRGQVVFVRWFTSPDCPFCSGSAPALRALHERYGHNGLTVVGMYHHKLPTPLKPEDVRGWARHYGYAFPVAIDRDWKTLDSWWLTGHANRGYTSVSFLIDKGGVVRRVHLGGLIEVNSAEFRAIDADVQRLLAERVSGAAPT